MHPEPRPAFSEPSREALVSQLGEVPALAGVSARALAALAELAKPSTFHAGETILAEGALATSFYVLLSGRVKMCRSLANGRTAVVALFGPGEIFGAVAALGERPCDAALVALATAFCLEVPRDELFARFEAEPRLVGDLLPVLTRQLVECRNCILELTCFRLEARFAQLLLKLAERAGERRAGAVFIPIALSRQELADMTGTTIESCIRIMSRWGKNGWVETQKGGFLIRDRAALERLAREDGEGRDRTQTA